MKMVFVMKMWIIFIPLEGWIQGGFRKVKPRNVNATKVNLTTKGLLCFIDPSYVVSCYIATCQLNAAT